LKCIFYPAFSNREMHGLSTIRREEFCAILGNNFAIQVRVPEFGRPKNNLASSRDFLIIFTLNYMTP